MTQNLYPLYAQLGVSKSLVTLITTGIDKFYYEKTQPKKKFGKDQKNEDGSIRLRHLLPPVNLLKLIQKKIYSQLQNADLPDCMFGSIQHSNNIMNALQHLDSKYFLTIDLKEFFSRINNKQVNEIFRENGYSWGEARTLTRLTTYKGSLPQGAPSSPVLANLAFKKTALLLQELTKKYNITFTTFLDDLTFSSRKDFKHLIPQILETINVNKFFPHYKKIHYRINTCEITGLIVGNGKIKLIPEMQKEALNNPRIRGYAKSVERHYQQYLLSKNS